MPAHDLQEFIDKLLIRRPRLAIEAPGATKHAGRDIELLIAQLVALSCVVEQAGGFRVNFDWSSLSRVDLMNDIVVAVAAELLFNSKSLAKRESRQLPRVWL